MAAKVSRNRNSKSLRLCESFIHTKILQPHLLASVPGKKEGGNDSSELFEHKTLELNFTISA